MEAKPPPDVQLVFAKDARGLARGLQAALSALPADGMIWLAWPKRSSGVPTELTRERVRAIGLRERLVDVKVCAIDETWSGLKFVVRKEERDAWPGPPTTIGT